MKNKILKYIKIILFITMIVLIYLVSPKITISIQNTAKFIYELEETYITRIVELLLTVTIFTTLYVYVTKKGK